MQMVDDDYDDVMASLRRASTQSLGPVVVPEPGRRDSSGRLIDVPGQPRRSSFQGICETAVSLNVHASANSRSRPVSLRQA